MKKERTLRTRAGIAFGNGSLAMASRMKAATNMVTPKSNPDNNAAIENHIPIIKPMELMISIKPVKKLKMGGSPKRSNSFAILPEIIFVPVNIKKIATMTCKTIRVITMTASSLSLFCIKLSVCYSMYLMEKVSDLYLFIFYDLIEFVEQSMQFRNLYSGKVLRYMVMRVSNNG